jgi:hypothetical protein
MCHNFKHLVQLMTVHALTFGRIPPTFTSLVDLLLSHLLNFAGFTEAWKNNAVNTLLKQQLHDIALHRAALQLQIRECGPTATLLPQLIQAIQTAGLQAKLTKQPECTEWPRRTVDSDCSSVPSSQISWHSAREGGEVVSFTHRSPLPPGMFLVLIFTRSWVDPRAMVRSEGKYVTEKSSDTTGNRSRDIPTSSATRSICIFLFNRTTLSFCDIPYRCSICAPFVILQTSTR